MDITQATTIVTAVIGLVSPVIIQIVKRWIPSDYRSFFALTVAIGLGCLGVAAVGGFGGQSWPVVLMAIVGVSQTAYTILDKSFGSSSYDGNTKPDTATDTVTPLPTTPVHSVNGNGYGD